MIVGKRHHHFDAISPDGLHADVEDALWIDSLLEDVNGLGENLVGFRTLRNLHRVDQADPALEILTKSNLFLRRIDGPETDADDQADQDELGNDVLHGQESSETRLAESGSSENGINGINGIN